MATALVSWILGFLGYVTAGVEGMFLAMGLIALVMMAHAAITKWRSLSG